jgi:hypothetical protein
MQPAELYRLIDGQLAAWLDRLDWLMASATPEQSRKLLAAKAQVFDMKARLDARVRENRWFDEREARILEQMFPALNANLPPYP